MIDGALMRDTRMVERKKTGSAKARKKVSWSPIDSGWRSKADDDSTPGSSDKMSVAVGLIAF